VWETQLNEHDEFMVLACDGVWGVMTSSEVVAFVRRLIVEDSKSSLEASKALIFACLSTTGRGHGTDNMTAVVVQLKGLATGCSNMAALPEVKKHGAAEAEAQAKSLPSRKRKLGK
jgi:serine/threonine protein phosphatase PrpC